MKRLVEREEYFTDPLFAQKCVELVESHCEISSFDAVVEPSAGTGVFLDAVIHPNVHAIDLFPRDPRVIEANYFEWSPPEGKNILVIGNPPFGQRAALALRFLEKSMAYASVVAMILPRSFKKYTFQEMMNPRFHLLDSLEGDTFFTASGQPITVKTVFQIWEKRDQPREKLILPTSHSDFEMKHAHLSRTSDEKRAELIQDYPFAIPQVGAMFRPRDSIEIDKGSWWFIRPKVEGVRERFEKLDFAFVKGMNTAHQSLSKRDIILAYQVAVDAVKNSRS